MANESSATNIPCAVYTLCEMQISCVNIAASIKYDIRAPVPSRMHPQQINKQAIVYLATGGRGDLYKDACTESSGGTWNKMAKAQAKSHAEFNLTKRLKMRNCIRQKHKFI